MTADAVRQALHNLRQRDLPSHAGRALARVYDSGVPEIDQLGREVIASFAATDGVDPEAYPSWIRMEQDLVALAGQLLNAPRSVVGTVTSGGAESALLTLQAARDSRPGLVHPTVVLPATAHPSYHQAARYLRVEPVFVPVDAQSCRADPAAISTALSPDTILVVASAPTYAHGVVDPVTDLADLAQRQGVRCHVDAGLGGWLLPYLRRQNPTLPEFSFEIPGVTSISVDLHKYAYTPKGAALLLHRTAELRRPQLFGSAAGAGYPMTATTSQQTRSGGPLAAAWAVTRYVGDHGYASLAASVRGGVAALVEGVETLSPVRVLARPDASVVAIATDGRCDAFTICDELASRGWYVQPQLSSDPFPPTVHVVMSAATVPRVPEFLDAFRASLKTAVAAGPVRVPAAALSAVRTLDLRTFDDEALDELLELTGIELGIGSALPDRMAPLNALLDAASGPVRQAVLVALLDRRSRPRR